MIHSKLIIYLFGGYTALFSLENNAMKYLSSSFGALALMVLAGTASAAQLNDAQANQVIASVQSTLKSQNSFGCVAVVDSSGTLLAFQRLDGSPLGCVDASIGKARTSALYRAPTLKFMQRLQNGENTVLSIPHVVALGGGYPLTLNGEVVGAVGVSTPKQEIDNQASQTAAEALK